jgi:hypothetical protein
MSHWLPLPLPLPLPPLLELLHTSVITWTHIARSSKMSAGFTGILYCSSTGRYVLDLASKMGARCHAATTRIVSRAHLR